jgi:ABC-type multidrug transport system fused ATPase/permease subunit
MNRTLFGFILKYSLREQILIVLLTVISFPFLYISLDLPKTIVNISIQEKHWPQEFWGIPLDQISHLLTLSFSYLGLVLINGGFKYFINVYKGKVGERMNRRLRYDLYHRILRFPSGYFRRIPPGQLIPMITAEIEPLGGFIGDSFAVPAFQGGTLLVILTFMCLQDPILGIAATALYPFQIWVIPKLQRIVNNLTKQRVRLVRDLSDSINETALSLREVQSHGTAAYHLAKFTSRMSINFWIRYNIFKWKFFIKFLNNFLAQLTPFFFYSIGGWLVIRGNLSLGALLAVVAAYKDLNAPWRELLDYYQQMEDARIRYSQVVEQFDPAGIEDENRFSADGPPLPDVAVLETHRVALTDETGQIQVHPTSLRLPAGQTVALMGPDNGGKHDLAGLLAGLTRPTAGQVTLGSHDISEVPRVSLARHIGFVGPETVLANASLYDNLVFGLLRRPADLAPGTEQEEARITGNSPFDPETDWLDITAAGCTDRADFDRRLYEVLNLLDLTPEIRELGLRGTIDPAEDSELESLTLKVRAILRPTLSEPALAMFFEPFDPGRFNGQCSLAENLLFGAPIGPTFAGDALAAHPFVRKVLQEEGIEDDLFHAARDVVRQLADIFQGLPPTHEFYSRFSFVEADELRELEQIEGRAGRSGSFTAAERQRFLTMIFRLVPARHRLDAINAKIISGILAARRRLAAELPETLRGTVEFLNPARFNPALPLLDNVIFGRLAPGQGGANSRLRQMIRDAIRDAGYLEEVNRRFIGAGLRFSVGVGGSRLSPLLRQKVALARALLKQSDFLILDDPLALMDGSLQATLMDKVLKDRPRGILWVLQRQEHGVHFSRILRMEEGSITEDSAPFSSPEAA